MTAGAVDLIEISLSGDIYATTAGERVRSLPLLRDTHRGSLGMNMIRVNNFLALGAGVLRIPLHSHDVSRRGDRLGNPRHR